MWDCRRKIDPLLAALKLVVVDLVGVLIRTVSFLAEEKKEEEKKEESEESDDDMGFGLFD